MSDNPIDLRSGATISAQELLARAAASENRAWRGLHVAIADFFLPDSARLDERTRSSLDILVREMVHSVEAEIREHGARLLSGKGESGLARALNGPGNLQILSRLSQSDLLHDPELMAELLGRVRQEAVAAALPMQAPDDPERPSLINRFVQHPDRVLAAGAMAVLIAESRRRPSPEAGQPLRTDLPAELHHRLVWWVAAALRERLEPSAGRQLALLDQCLTDAARRSLATYDEHDRLEAAVMRFAAAIDAQPQELPQMLVEALGDRRVTLFIALLAHALGVDYVLGRELTLDPGGERLWLALRALGLGRGPIARIGYALCEADPRRDVEIFADLLDAVVATDAREARDGLGLLRLDPDYRAAVLALKRAKGSE
ncbi:DUF2336 domain-containing protein [Sphingomonas sp. M1-B02]|uniref:DUF2336 domain-containing protein n=1 Tax=Sphingomonas sp. M1-B02 TaxID=3114300 RepID=UPI002240372E|nr:DUF2336 domain-containing protein [Sphingomonas sp. S6-11]UZK67122.1 DUF2336 domain-containing protein [Sphingomonas sp. S6-11]